MAAGGLPVRAPARRLWSRLRGAALRRTFSKKNGTAMKSDEIIDRRRLRRKLAFWRTVTILIVAAAIVAAVFWIDGAGYGEASEDQIAAVKIDGAITENDALIDTLDRIAEAPRVKGVILDIDSPGGTTVGGERIFDAVRRIAANKPVAAVVGGMAASAAYLVASAADHIVAHRTSIVGSIGVLIEYPNVTGLMDKLGIKLEAIKSSPLKAEPSPFDPTTDEERAMVRKLITDSYNWFVGVVAERRSIPRADALKLADGSIYTGGQGVANKLVDEVGGERQAIAWLATKGVDPKLKVVEWKPRSQGDAFWFSKYVGRAAARWLGLGASPPDIVRQLSDRIFLDGLLSVWHADPNGLEGLKN